MKRALIVTTKDALSGGNERFITALTKTLLTYNLVVEVKYITIDESSPQSILRAYRQAKNIRTANYDVVFSTKFPTYCVTHPLHINLHNHWFKRFYSEWKPFEKKLTTAQKKKWTACRKKVLKWDKQSLKQTIILAQSHTIKKRLEQKGHRATSITPPPIVFSKEKKKGTYFLVPSMLDNHKKRIDLIISAYRFVKTNRKLLITGTGKDEAQLKALAKQDKRIVFTGLVSDEKLKTLFSGAIATIQPAKDEDFGLSVAESLASGCPVITCYDSGGATEQVIHDVTGLIVEPRIDVIAQNIQKLASNTQLQQKLQQECIQNSRHQSWNEYLEDIWSEISRRFHAKPINAEEQYIKRTITNTQQPPPPTLNWDVVLTLCEQQGITPYIFEKAKKIMPQKVTKAFQKKLFMQQSINNQLLTEYNKITKVFEQHKIAHEALKGIDILKKKNSPRKTSDIDILIKKRDRDKAKQLLIKEGFIYHKNSLHEKKFFEQRFTSNKNKQLGIELKTKLDETFPLIYSDLKRNKEAKLFCFYAHHAMYKHPYMNLKWLVEGKQLLAEQNIQIKRVLTIAKKYKVSRSVRLFFYLLDKEFGYPTGITFTSKDKQVARAYYTLHHPFATFNTSYERYTIERIMHVLLKESISAKITAIYHAVLPTRGELAPFQRKKRLRGGQNYLKQKEFIRELWRAMNR
jgi:glycosyltransferase involved in cell wall biosynthesis